MYVLFVCMCNIVKRLSVCVSSVNSACPARSDIYLEENPSDQMFPHHLGSEDDGQCKSHTLSDINHVLLWLDTSV